MLHGAQKEKRKVLIHHYRKLNSTQYYLITVTGWIKKKEAGSLMVYLQWYTSPVGPTALEPQSDAFFASLCVGYIGNDSVSSSCIYTAAAGTAIYIYVELLSSFCETSESRNYTRLSQLIYAFTLVHQVLVHQTTRYATFKTIYSHSCVLIFLWQVNFASHCETLL